MPRPPFRRVRTSRPARLAAAAVVLVGLALGGALLLETPLDGRFLGARLSRALQARAGGGYTVAIADVAARPLRGSLRLEGLRLEGRGAPQDLPRPKRGGHPAAGHPPGETRDAPGEERDGPGEGPDGPAPHEPRVVAEAEAVELVGVDWLALLVRGSLRAAEIHVDRPVVRIAAGGREREPGRDGEPGPEEPLPLRLARALPELRAATLTLRGGVLCLGASPSDPCPPPAEEAGGPGPGAVRAFGIEASLGDLRVDRPGAADPTRTFFARETELALDSLQAGLRDGLTGLVTGPVRLSIPSSRSPSREAVLVAERLRWEPTVPDAEFFRRLPHRRDRVRLAVARCSVRSLDVGRWLWSGSVTAAAVTLDSLEADVRSDKNLPPRNVSNRFPLPIPRIGRFLLVDTVRLDGRVRYAEVPAGRARPGRVSFERLSVAARRVTTDPMLVSREEPTVVEVHGRLFGAVPTAASLRVHRLAPSLGVEFEGGAGPAALEASNAALVPLEGLRIDAGRVDTLWFRVRVEGEAATGSLVAIYRDLRISVRDPETGGSGVVKKLKSLLADWKVKSENLPGEGRPPRSGEIAHRVERTDGLFQIVWGALRSGIRDLVR